MNEEEFELIDITLEEYLQSNQIKGIEFSIRVLAS